MRQEQTYLNFAKLLEIVPQLNVCDPRRYPANEKAGGPAWICCSSGQSLLGITVAPTHVMLAHPHVLCICCVSICNKAKAPRLARFCLSDYCCLLQRAA